MKPTEEQEQTFWEWCGFRRYEDNDGHWKGCFYWHNPPNTAEWGATWLPDIDLNNLFKWVIDPNEYITEVSFVKGECQIATRGLNNKGVQYFIGKDEDRALALFWAIDKVKEIVNED